MRLYCCFRSDTACKFFQISFANGAHRLFDGLTALKRDDGGDAHYPKLSCQFFLFIYIDFGKFHSSCQFLSNFFKRGDKHLAGATPACPKIRLLVYRLYYFRIKIFRGNIQHIALSSCKFSIAELLFFYAPPAGRAA